MKTKLAILLTTLLLTACSAGINPNDNQAVSSGVKVYHDNYKKLTVYAAPAFQAKHRNSIMNGWGMISLVAAKQQTTGKVLYTISINTTAPKWYFFNSADDIDGNSLQTRQVKRDVNCTNGTCLHFEELQIIVSRTYLEQHAQTGLQFQVSGKEGSEEYTIPASYIQTFLNKVPF